MWPIAFTATIIQARTVVGPFVGVWGTYLIQEVVDNLPVPFINLLMILRVKISLGSQPSKDEFLVKLQLGKDGTVRMVPVVYQTNHVIERQV